MEETTDEPESGSAVTEGKSMVKVDVADTLNKCLTTMKQESDMTNKVDCKTALTLLQNKETRKWTEGEGREGRRV